MGGASYQETRNAEVTGNLETRRGRPRPHRLPGRNVHEPPLRDRRGTGGLERSPSDQGGQGFRNTNRAEHGGRRDGREPPDPPVDPGRAARHPGHRPQLDERLGRSGVSRGGREDRTPPACLWRALHGDLSRVPGRARPWGWPRRRLRCGRGRRDVAARAPHGDRPPGAGGRGAAHGAGPGDGVLPRLEVAARGPRARNRQVVLGRGAEIRGAHVRRPIMQHILAIQSSATGEGAASRLLVEETVDRLRAANPAATVTWRDLGESPVPHLTTATLAGVRGEPATAAERTSRALSDALIAELRA